MLPNIMCYGRPCKVPVEDVNSINNQTNIESSRGKYRCILQVLDNSNLGPATSTHKIPGMYSEFSKDLCRHKCKAIVKVMPKTGKVIYCKFGPELIDRYIMIKNSDQYLIVTPNRGKAPLTVTLHAGGRAEERMQEG